jgi:hypothetical protein
MTDDTPAERLAERARQFSGYRSRGLLQNDFNAWTGTGGMQWDGAFLDYIAALEKLPGWIPVNSTASALREYVRTRRLYQSPKPGDIAFFAFPAHEPFRQVHVGLVTDVTEWKRARRFKTVEAQVSSGLPKGRPEEDGVYERTRYGYDVIGFGRPDYKTARPKKTASATVTASAKLNRGETVTVQLALGRAVGLTDATKGVWDSKTASAYASWQRRCGMTRVNGFPDADSLRALSEHTGLFRVA